MQKGHQLEFKCQGCEHLMTFSVFDLDNHPKLVCPSCGKAYLFDDYVLKRQLRKFEALCQQLVDSEEILGAASVGIDIGDRHVRVPYKILLTRLSSVLELKIGDQPLAISFRIEPISDTPLPEEARV